jgi:hypothetical protein
MNPFKTAQTLRHIAAKIQNSKNPDRNLVARDLKLILAAINPEIKCEYCGKNDATVFFTFQIDDDGPDTIYAAACDNCIKSKNLSNKTQLNPNGIEIVTREDYIESNS